MKKEKAAKKCGEMYDKRINKGPTELVMLFLMAAMTYISFYVLFVTKSTNLFMAIMLVFVLYIFTEIRYTNLIYGDLIDKSLPFVKLIEKQNKELNDLLENHRNEQEKFIDGGIKNNNKNKRE